MGSNGIKHVRVDERLIHGQVATMWTNTIKATRIMIVDDAVVKNEMEKVALKTAVPAGVKLSILTVKGAASFLNRKITSCSSRFSGCGRRTSPNQCWKYVD